MIEKIAREDFKRYGLIIEYPDKEREGRDKSLFCITLKVTEAAGWRIAYLILRDKSIGRLERHSDSFESFEPVSGETLIYVADKKDAAAIRCFRLDRPVILNKGVWHGVVTLGDESEIKITENAEVECGFWELGFELDGHGHR